MDMDKVPKIEIDNVHEFIISLPNAVKEEWLEGVETVFHFDIEGDTGGKYTVLVKDRQMEVHEALIEEPKCVVKTKEVHFLQLLKGELNPMMAVFTGKLKVSNPGEIMKYAKLFGIG